MQLRTMVSCLSAAICLWLIGTISLHAQADKPEFKPSGKVWGYAFGDAYYKMGGDTAAWASRAEYSPVPKEAYAFGLRRMYLGYDYNISPVFTTSALLEANDGILTPRNDRTVTIKALNVRWNGIYKGGDLVFGQMSTLAFSFIAEKVWGYRSLEKTIVDMRGIRSSSDMGLALYGKIDSIGSVGYNLMIGNGSSTRPEDLTPSGRHKIYSGELYAYVLDRKIVLDLYADHQTGVGDRSVTTLKGCIGYQTTPFTLGAELFTQTNAHNKSDGTDAVALGFSVFARGRLIKDKLFAFARFDTYNPDTKYRDADVITTYNASQMLNHYEETFFIGGLDFTPHKNVHVMPNVWVNSYTPKADSPILVDREADIVPRLTCYFIFR